MYHTLISVVAMHCRVDRFLVECISVGKLNGLCFRLVKSGLSPNWFLDHVEVQEWGSEGETISNIPKNM